MSGAPIAEPGHGALPVALHLGGRDAEAVRRWVEGVLGWQPVDVATQGLVPPAVALQDLDVAPGRSDPGVPVVLVVADDATAEQAARTAAAVTPAAVVGWPSGRDDLAGTVAEVVARPPRGVPGRRVMRVGGSAGGVGTTTVSLALAGLSAWSGARTLAAVRGAGLQVRDVPASAVAGVDLFTRADPIPGVPALRAVRVIDHDPVPDPGDASIEALVVDAGADADVDVIVCRPDAAALAVPPVTTAAAVVLVGDGPARPRDLLRAADGRRGVRLPWSARVARAGLAGRVPAGLPGAWLRRLVPLAPHLDDAAVPTGDDAR